jgi:hypothetical protein
MFLIVGFNLISTQFNIIFVYKSSQASDFHNLKYAIHMKKIYFSLLGLAVCLVINAQIKLTCKTHGLTAGDAHDFIFTSAGDEGQSGRNIIWDFTSLQPNDQKLTSHMFSPEKVEKSSEIPQANLVLEEFGNQFYFNVTNDGMEQYGTISGNTVTTYDKPFVKLKFPFTYGDDVTGFYSGVQFNPNSSVPISGTYEIVGDAYGTLLLPNNVTLENVLRVKQSRTINYPNGSTIDEITYRWYSANVRYPILVIIKYVTPEKSYVAETAVYAHAGSKTKSATDVSAIQNGDVKVYPNPYEKQLTVSYELKSAGDVSILIYSADGKMTKTALNSLPQEAGTHNFVINAQDNFLLPGVYYIKVKMNENIVTNKVVKIR